jgi:hypothetical protein
VCSRNVFEMNHVAEGPVLAFAARLARSFLTLSSSASSCAPLALVRATRGARVMPTLAREPNATAWASPRVTRWILLEW